MEREKMGQSQGEIQGIDLAAEEKLEENGFDGVG
jgi:hypothetical protein